jgi:bifunctional DNA primase/polymerase-like protein
MSTLQAALDLAAKGCHVFPIIGKKPGITRWQWQATTDADKIRSWWSQPRFRDASISIHPLGLLVLDIDGPLGEANLQKLRERYPVPPTLKVISGNTAEPSHYQFFYRLPDGYRAIPRPLDSVPCFRSSDKIDIKGSGGQVVGPGSIHKTGGVYRWEREPTNI